MPGGARQRRRVLSGSGGTGGGGCDVGNSEMWKDESPVDDGHIFSLDYCLLNNVNSIS